ncbi:MAG: hypothetical protein QNJ85_13635 [Gammaproteobacteria bacterium]|nr:hypothetical protein [Gammaproteobacteria bacterium]
MQPAFHSPGSGRKPLRWLATCVLVSLIAGCDGSSSDDDDPLPVVPRSIDFCSLQAPVIIDDTENTVVTVFGRVFSAGVTDMSGVNDPDPAIIGSVGVGPDGSNPALDPGWSWANGQPNAGYGPGSPTYNPNHDEYRAGLMLPGPAGDYDFAFRFSGDAGATFTYCDGGMGTTDGYAPADAGQLTSSASLLFREYIDGSADNKAIEVFSASAGTVDLSACQVRIYANGSAAATAAVTLAGNLAPGDLHVVCKFGAGGIIAGACDTANADFDFDGNDAIELVCAGDTLDVIGEIGFDPVLEWAGGGAGTANETLRRDCLVTLGDSDGSDAFDPSAEWTSTGLVDLSNIGIDHCP